MITVTLAVAPIVAGIWQLALAGGRLLIPLIIEWIATSYALDYALEKGQQKAEEMAKEELAQKNYSSIFGKFFNQTNSLSYEEATVFVFSNIAEYQTVINNYRNRGTMADIFSKKIYSFLNQDKIKGSDVLAFRDVNHLKNSKLFPNNKNFFKILNKVGCFYYFYGDNFFFIYVNQRTGDVFSMIEAFFIRSIPMLKKYEEKNKGSIAAIKNKLGEKISSPLEILKEDKFRIIRFPTVD
jgi:hypothetical protein